MSRILSPLEYSAATQEIKALQTAIAQRRLHFLRQALRKLETEEGRKRALARAVIDAQAYKRTIVIAERVALDEMRNPYENAELGRARLAAAVAELYRKPQGAAAHKPSATTPTPGITHGLRAYRKKLCKCDECRAANAAARRKYKANAKEREKREQQDHTAKQHTDQTTEAA
ncbi:hypothetical protein SEA_SHADE_41 [Arthrobacter phage Shade]|uniref:Uncharacterized protein n=1 Tax=Arthrobacter phage Shade TaxID=2024283 RepID=A0A222ZA37_9CAUD|nr:hypothetical protein FDI42_gp41 [Arthrobacter phage Shade]ASR80746.1 hypothetical protein SEA_SHADE_41 [Arthrobacter phage Shade]